MKSMTKTFSKGAHRALRNQDLFGHLITLNFETNGETHKTLIGGLISIITKIFISIYFFFRIKKLIFLEGAITAVSNILMKVDLQGEVPLSDLQLTSFYVLNRQVEEQIFMDDPEVARYLDFYFVEETVDWNKPEKDRYTRVNHTAERCRQEHFGDSEHEKSLFVAWREFSLVCLNL
jgi:hypothetical protein